MLTDDLVLGLNSWILMIVAYDGVFFLQRIGTPKLHDPSKPGLFEHKPLGSTPKLSHTGLL